jgi:GAF domain-containing protein
VVLHANWAKSIHAVSLSDKYAAWRTYDERPDGSGIYALVCRLNGSMRLTQAELERHSAWRGFGAAAQRHPPMRGWLAVPLTDRRGRNIGIIQLSDKYEGEFSAADEASLLEFGRLASVALEQARRAAARDAGANADLIRQDCSPADTHPPPR